MMHRSDANDEAYAVSPSQCIEYDSSHQCTAVVLPATDEFLICSYVRTVAALSGWMEEHRLLACTTRCRCLPQLVTLVHTAWNRSTQF